jgi:hypothetical protein
METQYANLQIFKHINILSLTIGQGLARIVDSSESVSFQYYIRQNMGRHATKTNPTTGRSGCA